MAEELQTFKVSDLQRKTHDKAASPANKRDVPHAKTGQARNATTDDKPSAGFPRVEALIDEYATATQAKDVLSESVAQLEGLLANEKNHKKKAEIVKAKRSFELTLDTLDYLFQVKTELTQAAMAQPSRK